MTKLCCLESRSLDLRRTRPDYPALEENAIAGRRNPDGTTALPKRHHRHR